MAAWLKILIVLLGLVLLAGVLQRFGLPSAPLKEAAAPSTQQATPETPAGPATSQQAAGAPSSSTDAKPAEPKPAETKTAESKTAEPKSADASGPTFDVVRVEPDGSSVIAGRSIPGAEILLLLNGAVHERAKADAGGQFAIVPRPFPAGNHELTLQVRHPDGRIESSKQTVTVVVPSTAGGDVIVALAQPDRPTELLSRPRAAAVAAAGASDSKAAAAGTPAGPAAVPGQRPKIVVTTVEAEDGGRLYATGQAAPGAIVRLYLNDTFLATATAAPDGRWSFTIGRGLEPGSYRVRVDDVEQASGNVISRAEVPFTFSPRVASAAAPGSRPGTPAGTSQPGSAGAGASGASAGAGAAAPPNLVQGADALVAEIRSTMVSRGDSLWRISRRVYGKGMRYTVIYEANQQQIRDPGRIYPGQMFVVPADKP